MLRLLAALDFSDCSRLALATALDIARRLAPAELTVLTVLESLSGGAAQSEGALGDVERACTALGEMVDTELRAQSTDSLPAGVRVHYTSVRGHPAEEIVAQALVHKADVIVMGSHGRRGLNRLIAGSVAEKVVRTAPCSVLTVKPKKTA